VPSSERLDHAALGARLDAIFSFDVSSGRNYDELIEPLLDVERATSRNSRCTGPQVAARTHLEIAYLAVLLVPQALRRLSRRQAEAWLVAALEGFDRSGLRAAVVRLRDIDGFARGAFAATVLALQDVDARLGRFLQGLSGRSLRIAAADAVWTDTETVFLPPADRGGQPARLGTERYKVHGHPALGPGPLRQLSMSIIDAALPASAPGATPRWPGWHCSKPCASGRGWGASCPECARNWWPCCTTCRRELDSAHAALAAPQAGMADSLDWLRLAPTVAGRACQQATA
jgi:hypothetical protein